MSQSLDEFFATRDWSALESVSGWSATRDEADQDIVYLAVKARDGEQYRVRCICDGYPSEPPSVAFVNDSGSKDDVRAWPRGTPELDQEVKAPPSCFLCMPLTREGLAHHPNWRTEFPEQAWSPAKHTLLDIFNRVRRLLHADYYTGRGGPPPC
jgi:hypothetical protein